MQLIGAVIFGLVLLAVSAQAAPVRSIRHWAVCDGRADDSRGVAAAFSAAAGGRFTLLVDCPVYIHTGMDVTRPVFVESGTDVVFAPGGEFILDNTLIPAFVVDDSADVRFLNWRVVYTGGLPVDMNTGFYVAKGRRVASNVMDPPGAAFLRRETAWLAARRGVRFVGGAQAPWHGPANTTALFYIGGDSSDVVVSGMILSVPAGAGGNRFIPMVFSMTYGVLPGVALRAGQAVTAAAFAVPSGLRFYDISIDGAYMGWQGSARDLVITHVRSYRYGDLQNVAGGQVGGASVVHGKLIRWFAPPHLIYLNYNKSWDPALYNRDIHVCDVIDYGQRVGVARDNSSNCCSGNALSLKIGAIDSDVMDYESDRPDGLLDVLDSDHLLLSNITGRYDSGFLHGLYPGIRFPGDSYNDVTLRDVTLVDDAARTVRAPVSAAGTVAQQGTVLQNVNVFLNRWASSDAALMPRGFAGIGDDIAIAYRIGGARLLFRQKDGSKALAVNTNVP